MRKTYNRDTEGQSIEGDGGDELDDENDPVERSACCTSVFDVRL